MIDFLEALLFNVDSLISTAIGVITALSWNNAITKFFDSQPKLKSHGPWLYAIIITFIALMYSIITHTIKEKIKKEKIKL